MSRMTCFIPEPRWGTVLAWTNGVYNYRKGLTLTQEHNSACWLHENEHSYLSSLQAVNDLQKELDAVRKRNFGKFGCQPQLQVWLLLYFDRMWQCSIQGLYWGIYKLGNVWKNWGAFFRSWKVCGKRIFTVLVTFWKVWEFPNNSQWVVYSRGFR